MTKRWYVGIVNGTPYNRCDIFGSTLEPTPANHGFKYAFCFGGYRTKAKAIQVAMYHNYGIDTPQPDKRTLNALRRLDEPSNDDLYLTIRL
jgi:hypothetical protein